MDYALEEEWSLGDRVQTRPGVLMCARHIACPVSEVLQYNRCDGS